MPLVSISIERDTGDVQHDQQYKELHITLQDHKGKLKIRKDSYHSIDFNCERLRFDDEIIIELCQDFHLRSRQVGIGRIPIARVVAGQNVFSGEISVYSKDFSQILPFTLKATVQIRDFGEDIKESLSSIKICCSTWNVGNSAPPENLSGFLPEGADVYVVAAQECQYGSDPFTCAQDWLSKVHASLPHGFTLLTSVSLWEMRLLCFVRENLMFYVSKVRSASEATGVGNVVGNKGGLGIAFSFGCTSFCFVGAHLAAHVEHFSARNEMYYEIIEGLSDKMANPLTSAQHCFWMGDLNYRVEMQRGHLEQPSLADEFACINLLICSGNLKALSGYDQLTKAIEQGRAFGGFKEGKFWDFCPTFKMFRNDSRQYVEERAPSWCDRVLWRSEFVPDDVKIVQYSSCHELSTSDHKPVFGMFDVKVFTGSPMGVPSSGKRIIFHELKGRNLRVADVSGTSDPYLIITSSLLRESFVSPVIKKTLDPEWLPQSIFVNQSDDEDEMRNSLLMIQVKDKDYASADDDMGYCALSLSSALGNQFHFCVDVLYNGKPSGQLYGVMEIANM